MIRLVSDDAELAHGSRRQNLKEESKGARAGLTCAAAWQLCAAGFTVWLDLERMASNATAGVGVMPDAMSSRIRGASPVVCFVAE